MGLLLGLITDQRWRNNSCGQYWQQRLREHLILHLWHNISIRMKLFSKARVADGKILRYGENPHQRIMLILTPCLTNYTEKNYLTTNCADVGNAD
jgi:AICAR transformylase/IMP cyclohydrolase PurH